MFFLSPKTRYAGAMTEQICRNLEKLDRAKLTLESQDVTLESQEATSMSRWKLGSKVRISRL